MNKSADARRVLDAIRKNGPMSAKSLAASLGMGRDEVNRLLYGPELKDMVEKFEESGVLWRVISHPTTSSRIDSMATPHSAVETYFAPDVDCKQIMAEEIRRARSSIKIQAYMITCPRITQSLVKALGRRVEVDIIVGKLQEGGDRQLKQEVVTVSEALDRIFEAGGRIRQDRLFNHKKIVIVDDMAVLTGSINLTVGSEKSAEAFYILRHPQTVRIHVADWEDAKQRAGRPLRRA